MTSKLSFCNYHGNLTDSMENVPLAGGLDKSLNIEGGIFGEARGSPPSSPYRIVRFWRGKRRCS